MQPRIPSLPQLGQYLLTRSDLARLSIPAARILSWLAGGSLEQFGSLPNGRAGGEPVYTVLTRDLRQELAQRLTEIGKTNAVFTPLRVRSLLLRAMLAARLDATTADESGREATEIAGVATQLEQSDLGSLLRRALQEIGAEASTVEQIAAEEAAREAAELGEGGAERPTDLDGDATDGATDGSALPGDAGTAAPGATDEAGFYDPADLLLELQSWGEDPVDGPTDPLAATPPPEPAPAEQDEALGPTAAELDALRDALAASLADYRNVDKPFGPDAPSLDTAEPVPPAAPEDPFERLSATLEQVRALVQEAASLDVFAELGPTRVPEPSDATLATLTALDEPVRDEPSMPAPGDAEVDVNMDAASPNAPAEPESPALQLIELDPIDDGLPVDDSSSALAGCGAQPTSRDEAPILAAVGEEPEPAAAEDAPPLESATVGEALDAMFGLHEAEPASFGAVDAPAGAVEAPAAPPTADPTADFVLTEVRTFLGELRESLVGLAKGPGAQAADLDALVEAVRTGFESSQRELAQTNVAIGALVERVATVGSRIEHRIAGAPRSDGGAGAVVAGPGARSGASLALLAVSLLIACWSLVLWWKTGSARLAIGTMLGANAVACCVLLGRR